MTAGELLRLLDAYANRIDPDYVDHRFDFLNAGHRWCEQKFHFREAQYAKWQMTERLPTGVAVLPLPGCYRHSAEIRVTLLPDRTALARVKPSDLRVGPWVDPAGVSYDFRDTRHLNTPTHYAIIGRSIELRPVPATDTEIEVSGTGWADPMLTEMDETVLTQEAPYAVLYASLRECWLFMGDDPQQQYWAAQAERAVVEWAGDRIHEENPPVMVMETYG
jgi:hypothetical protein